MNPVCKKELDIPLDGQPDFLSYDRIIVAFSGGKDSLACMLHLLDVGIPRNRIELWHHRIDGVESHLMDWPVTESYCEMVAAAFGIPLFFSWKEGGFEREMLRNDSPTAPIHFQSLDGLHTTGGLGPNGTRQKFPQVSGNLAIRWCSPYGKIDVAAAALRNDTRFVAKRTLVVTGERAEESAGRAKYAKFEPHKADRRNGKSLRHIDHWRPVHSLDEAQVWEIIKKYRVNPHPAYWLGFGRVSCMKCIFGSANQWATVRQLDPSGFAKIESYERDFGLTIHRTQSVTHRADLGIPYPMVTGRWREIAMQKRYTEPVFMDRWEYPSGAFGESSGPT
jgi:3'-phosphoadenosine 5'-phosphosulfate sulfotransferase (PAPS reductase)/FAD synthetase